ncbi:MAG: D-alanyl-D-alanine carboxypeptidase [Thermoanaerobaculum sp.]|nr:D-alanyl-D-alanine carboxypeptidase [Thermoanaerobaculum sp.]
MGRRLFLGFLLLIFFLPQAEGANPRRKRPARPPLQLVWHVEDGQGEVVASHRGEEAINPASVVKVATTLWALEKLGPDLALETRFFARGGVDWQQGRVRGDLVVQGSGDPDFQVENALLVARALNEMGIYEVHGAVVVNDRFWMGWENGSAGTEPDPIKRGLAMATRLRQALDRRRWNGSLAQAWRALAERRGWEVQAPPRLTVWGGVGADGRSNLGELLVVHRSKPLKAVLHRFNAFSNNDIERLGALLGPSAELAGMLKARLDLPEVPTLDTLSGLGANRLSPRSVVHLLRELEVSCALRHLAVGEVLPVAGCHPGTLEKFFPILNSPPFAGSVVGKTGTLTFTDGGVAVLAGLVSTGQGEFFFCLASPNASGRLREARRLQEQWLVRFIQEHGGPNPLPCATPVVEADEGSVVIKVSQEPPPSTSSGGEHGQH